MYEQIKKTCRMLTDSIVRECKWHDLILQVNINVNVWQHTLRIFQIRPLHFEMMALRILTDRTQLIDFTI